MVIITNKTEKRTNNICPCINFTRRRKNNSDLLNKKDFSFGIFIDKLSKKKLNKVFNLIISNNLTIYGDGTGRAANRMNSPISEGLTESDMLVFGKNKNFDVELSDAIRTVEEKKMFNLHPVYELSKNFDEIVEAISQFASKKKSLEKKQNRNKHSRTMNELLCKENDCNKKNNKKKQEIIVSANYIRIGTTYIDKNSVDVVKYKNGNTTYKIPNCYWEA